MRPRLTRAIVVLLIAGPAVTLATAAWLRSPGGLPDYDPSAVVACADFRRLVRDIGDDILTPEDFRARVRSIQELARLADPVVAPGVAENAGTLLRAATGTADDAIAAIDLMKHACSLRGAKLR